MSDSPYARNPDACEVCGGPFQDLSERVNPVFWKVGDVQAYLYVCETCYREEPHDG